MSGTRTLTTPHIFQGFTPILSALRLWQTNIFFSDYLNFWRILTNTSWILANALLANTPPNNPGEQGFGDVCVGGGGGTVQTNEYPVNSCCCALRRRRNCVRVCVP